MQTSTEKSRKRSARNKIWYLNFISGKSCTHCGNKDHRTFQWHHLDPDKKDFSISRMLSRYSIAAILAEIKKCILLCANCHTILHYEERGKIRKTRLPSAKLDI